MSIFWELVQAEVRGGTWLQTDCTPGNGREPGFIYHNERIVWSESEIMPAMLEEIRYLTGLGWEVLETKVSKLTEKTASRSNQDLVHSIDSWVIRIAFGLGEEES